MGFKNSPAVFQRIMERILLEELKSGEARVYIDDILLMSETLEEHKILVQKVLRKLKEYGMETNWKKVKLAQRQIDFLGHTLSGEWVKPLDNRVKYMMSFPAPNSCPKVRRFLGIVNFMSRHIPRLAEMRAPLNEFSEKGKKFAWEERHQRAFDAIKEAIAQDLACYHPDPNLPFELEVDAAQTGVGAELRQRDRRIALYHGNFTAAQRRYPITDREFLAAVRAMRKFAHYLLGKPFTLYTDHKALEAMLTKKDFGSERIQKWLHVIEPFDFVPVYRPGKELVVADALSRMNEDDQKSSHAVDETYAEAALEERILQIHRSFDHRKSLIKVLKDQGIWISQAQLRSILSSCRTCLEYDDKRAKRASYIETASPGELLGIDRMKKGSVYVIVAVDYFSRKAFTKAVSSKEASKIVDFLDELYKNFKFQKIISDCGTEFSNHEMTSWLERNKVDSYFRPPYYHQGTGRVERLIRTLRQALRKTQGPVKRILASVTKNYNDSFHRALGMPPNMAILPKYRQAVLDNAER